MDICDGIDNRCRSNRIGIAGIGCSIVIIDHGEDAAIVAGSRSRNGNSSITNTCIGSLIDVGRTSNCRIFIISNGYGK